MKRETRERWEFSTPEHLIDAVRKICVELDREYPYLAEFQREKDGTWRLSHLHTVSRSMSVHYGELIGRTGWDVDWIERDGQYAYHQSSGGGSLRSVVSGTYWRHPSMLYLVREGGCCFVDGSRQRARRIRRIPIDLDGHEDMMQWLENTAIESEVYYCAVCREYLPDRPEDQCGHVWDCDEDAVMRGPGSVDYPDPCGNEECWGCQWAIERGLSRPGQDHDPECSMNFEGDECNCRLQEIALREDPDA